MRFAKCGDPSKSLHPEEASARAVVEKLAGRVEARCSMGGARSPPCPLDVATLLKWLKVRTTILHMGVGTSWQAPERQQFLPPKKGAVPHVELGDQLGAAEMLERLRHPLALQGRGGAVLRAAKGSWRKLDNTFFSPGASATAGGGTLSPGPANVDRRCGAATNRCANPAPRSAGDAGRTAAAESPA